MAEQELLLLLLQPQWNWFACVCCDLRILCSQIVSICQKAMLLLKNHDAEVRHRHCVSIGWKINNKIQHLQKMEWNMYLGILPGISILYFNKVPEKGMRH